MSDNNLTIGVTLDSSKLPTDIALMKAQLSNANKEVRNIAQDTAAKGSGADKGPLQDAVAVAGTIKGHLAAATAQQAALNLEAKTFRDRIKEALEHMERFRARIPLGEFGGATGGLISSIPLSGPLLGVGAAIAVATAAVKLGLDAARTSKEIANLANALDVSTGQIRAWDQAAKSAGVNADVWRNFLEHVAVAAEKASEKQRELTINAAKIGLTDDSGLVSRGGETSKPTKPSAQFVNPVPIDLDQIKQQVDQEFQERLKARGEAFRRLDPEGTASAFRDPAGAPPREFEKTFELERLNRARTDEAYRKSLDERGAKVPFKSELEALTSLETKSKDVFQKLRIDVNDLTNEMRPFDDILKQVIGTLSRLSGPERLKDSVELGGKSARDVTLQGFIGRGADGALNTPRSEDPDIARGAAAEEKINKILAEGAETMLQVGLKELQAAEAFKAGIDTVLSGVANTAVAAFDGVTSAAGRAATALDAVAKAGAGGAPLFQQAGGGWISGPGTSTSDSILGRLSDGEHVTNAREARAFPGLLNAINSGQLRRAMGGFASGGWVGDMPIPAYAGGGRVSSDGGALHLHIGDRSYEAHAPQRTLEDLAHAARYSDTVSLGRKPSTMYGAR